MNNTSKDAGWLREKKKHIYRSLVSDRKKRKKTYKHIIVLLGAMTTCLKLLTPPSRLFKMIIIEKRKEISKEKNTLTISSDFEREEKRENRKQCDD